MKRSVPFCTIAMLVAFAGFAWPGAAAFAEDTKAPKPDRTSEERTAPEAPEVNPIIRAARERAPAGPDVVVITNDVLERRYSLAPRVDGESFSNADLRPLDPNAPAPAEAPQASPEAPATPPPAQMEDPLVWMQKREEAARQRQEAIRQAEAELAAARQRVAELEKQALAVVNPYAPRPRLTAEEMEKRQTSGEDAAQRLQRTQDLLEQAREEVAAAEDKLAEAYRQ